MYANSDITLYLYKKVGRVETYERRVIKCVYWEDTKQSSFLRTGQRNQSNALVIIPFESLDESISFTSGKDYIVKGIVDLEIDSTDSAVMAKSLLELKSLNNCLTIVSVDERLFGSIRVQHYELSCK